jgi:hypothetical protein
VLAPPGTDLDSFILLSERGLPSDDTMELYREALDIAMPIFDALGVPRELFLGGVAVKELMSLGQKFKEAQQIRSAAINR